MDTTDNRGYNQVFDLTNKGTEIRLRRRADMIINELSDCKNKNIMEIGSGTGEVAYWIAEKTGINYLATDLCVPFVEGAREKYVLPNLRYDVLDFNKPEQFQNEKFDYIIGTGILHHLYHNLDDVFKNIRNLLKDGGKIIFMEPNIYNPYIYFIFSYEYLREKTKLEPDEMAFSKTFITDKLNKAGYKDINVTYKDFLLPGTPMSLVNPVIAMSDILEKIPVLKNVSQSIFITAMK